MIAWNPAPRGGGGSNPGQHGATYYVSTAVLRPIDIRRCGGVADRAGTDLLEIPELLIRQTRGGPEYAGPNRVPPAIARALRAVDPTTRVASVIV